MVSGIAYGVCCIGFSKVLSKSVDQRYYIAIGTFVMTLSLILSGPIGWFGIPKSIVLFFIGLTM